MVLLSVDTQRTEVPAGMPVPVTTDPILAGETPPPEVLSVVELLLVVDVTLFVVAATVKTLKPLYVDVLATVADVLAVVKG